MAKENEGATSNKAEIAVPQEMQDALTGHLAETAAHHEHLSEIHKKHSEHHMEQAATMKASHEHFKAAAEAGGEHAPHHEHMAKMCKAMHDHHIEQGAFHVKKSDAHAKRAASCAKCAADFGGAAPAEKALKAARDAQPKVAKAAPAADPVVLDPTKLSEVGQKALKAIEAEFYASPEFKSMATEAMRKKAMADLAAETNDTPVTVGIAVPRDGMEKQNQGRAQSSADEELFEFAK